MQDLVSANTLLIYYERLSLCLFLVNLEIPIVTTSLVAITNDLQHFDLSSWIISAYLLGYAGDSRDLLLLNTLHRLILHS